MPGRARAIAMGDADMLGSRFTGLACVAVSLAVAAGVAAAPASAQPRADPPNDSASFSGGRLTVDIGSVGSLTVRCTDGLVEVLAYPGAGDPVAVPVTPAATACEAVDGITMSGGADVDELRLAGTDELPHLASLDIELTGALTELFMSALPTTLHHAGTSQLLVDSAAVTAADSFTIRGRAGHTVDLMHNGTKILSTLPGDWLVFGANAGTTRVIPAVGSAISLLGGGTGERFLIDTGGRSGSLRAESGGPPFTQLKIDGLTTMVVTSGRFYDFRLEPWVPLVYQRLLHRAPSAEDGAAWTYATTVERYPSFHTDRSVVPRGFVASPEFRRGLVDNLFMSILGRAPSSGEQASWSDKLHDGWSLNRVRAALAGSAEFASKHGPSRADLVDGLYQRLLGRHADSAGADHWIQRLAAGATVEQVAGELLSTPEAARRQARARFVQALERAPDAAGLRYWAQQVSARGELDALVRLISSDEAVAQAGR